MKNAHPQSAPCRDVLNAAGDTDSANASFAADKPDGVDLLVNPRRYFHKPEAVAVDESLTDPEKILVLSAWEEELTNEIENQKMPQQVYESSTYPDQLESVQELLNDLTELPDSDNANRESRRGRG